MKLEMAANSTQFQNALQVVFFCFVFCFRMYDLKMSFIKFDGCNGPLDNVSYISSYENRHFIFLYSAESKEAKISSKRPRENKQHYKMLCNVFQPCQLYYLLS